MSIAPSKEKKVKLRDEFQRILGRIFSNGPHSILNEESGDTSIHEISTPFNTVHRIHVIII